jgi:signal transduction histidine kinase
MRRFSITEKLIIASLFLSILTILFVATYSFINTKEAILDRTFNQLTSVRVIKASLINQFFKNSIKEVRLAKSSADIKEIAASINTFKSQQELIDAKLLTNHEQFTNEIQEIFFNRIFIIGKNNLVCPIKNGHDQPEDATNNQMFISELALENKLQIRDFEKHGDRAAVMLISAPISNKSEEAIGHIVFELLSNSIDSIMLEFNPSHGLGVSGESYLVGSDFLMRSSSRFQEESILKTTVHTEAVRNALKGEEGIGLIKDYRDIKVLSSYNQLNLPGLNWVIISEIDYREATIPIYRIRNEIVFFSIFIFSLVLFVVYILSRRITIPIQKLNVAAKEVGAGNLNIDLKTRLTDEIGELTASFNQMAQELKEERKKSLGSLIDGQDTERHRLSMELHDSLGQSLIGLKLKYENCINKSQLEADEKHKYKDISTLIDQTIEETRRISNDLMPAALKEFGLFTAMRLLCNNIADTTNIAINFRTNGSDQRLPARIKNYIFRIAQESITNILKHSKAKHASIFIEVSNGVLVLKINDDGVGFNPSKAQKNSSNGMNNIEDRVRLLNGKLEMKSAIGKGTQIHISIPLKSEKNG